MKVQDEWAKDRIQLPWDFQIKNLGEEFYDADLTLRQHELFQSQNDQVTENTNWLFNVFNKSQQLAVNDKNKHNS